MDKEGRSFSTILKEYNGMIYHLLKNLNIHDRENEFYQIAAIALWKATESFDPKKGTFSTFAYAYIKGELLTELRRRKKFYDHHALRDEWSFDVEEEYTQDMDVESFIWLEQLSDVLTPNQLKWVKAYCIEGKPPIVIAEELGVTIAQVKSWRKSALRKLKKYV
ncbi:sigma-70 family RNA polymerase sigma factor [Bacillus sp. FJAT-47783]|uniref:sigma-70 family RNA polymerase sigma factor n=1 Tax=Bacillus sp. FJAT-47783 TaxID=2922712 RepID=UPI001FAE1175|nr:sigma-70 family RNA polymerase sigma factor [Bacillus sp. FJAT-47783]